MALEKQFRLKKEARQKLLAQAKKLLSRRTEILFAYAFGSFLSSSPPQDLDIGVYVTENALGREQAIDYELSLAVEMEKALHLPVDVKVLNYIPVPLGYMVSKGRLLFSRAEETRFSWLEMTWDRYFDMQYFLRNSLNDLLFPGE